MTTSDDISGLHPVLLEGARKRRSEPAYSSLSLDDARALQRSRMVVDRQPDLPLIEDFTIDGQGGPLNVRLYRPSDDETLPMMVYLHGGGFVFGTLDGHDSVLRRLAKVANCAILSVEYRLAPEHRFPAGVDDAEAGIAYAIKRWGPVFVGGDSAGAALAFAASEPFDDVRGLVLFYPVTDMAQVGQYASTKAFGDGRVGLSADDMRWFTNHYADAAQLRDPRCSILYFTDRTVPPTLVITAEFDVLRSEGEALVERLQTRGAPVTSHAAKGVNHGYLGAGEAVPEVAATMQHVGHWLHNLSRS